MIIVMIMVGLTQGMQPIVGYNYGAKRIQRVKETLFYTIKVGGAIGCIGLAIGVLLPDMTAQVCFVLAQARDVLTLPAAAVSNSSEAKDKGFVQVPGPSGPTQRAVETGLRNRELVEIVSGLAEGDSVLLPASGPSTTAKASESPPRRGLLGGPH